MAIVAFGDSLTFGFNATQSCDYPTVLSKIIGAEIVNRGVCGENCIDAVVRAQKEIIAQQPPLFIFFHGTNDLLNGVDENELFQAAKKIIDFAAKSAYVLVLSPVVFQDNTMRPFRGYDSLGRENVIVESELFYNIAKDESTRSDLVHLNDKGYGRLAKKISEFIHENQEAIQRFV